MILLVFVEFPFHLGHPLLLLSVCACACARIASENQALENHDCNENATKQRV